MGEQSFSRHLSLSLAHSLGNVYILLNSQNNAHANVRVRVQTSQTYSKSSMTLDCACSTGHVLTYVSTHTAGVLFESNGMLEGPGTC